jgi:TolB protein
MRRWKIVCAVMAVSLWAPLASALAVHGPAASAATFPGTNGPIAFVLDDSSGVEGSGDIWIMSPDGSSAMQLTDDPANDTDPAVSPDGSMIAFESDRSGTYQIYIMGNDGSGVTRLTTDGGSAPTWSPDGTKILFGGPGGDLWLMDADGTDPVQLTDTPAVVEMYSTWSPDGTKIAYTSDPSDLALYVMDADGTDPVLLTDDIGVGLTSSWSPDGTKIVFACDTGIPWGDQLCTIAPDGSQLTVLNHSDVGVPMEPSWSPDGTRIVFRSSFGIGGQLNVMDADGTNVSTITHYQAGNRSPSWGSGTSSRTEITTFAPDPPITGLPYSVLGTVTVDPAWPHPNEGLPGSVQVSDGVQSCWANANPTADAGVYAFSCGLTAGDPGGVSFTASYSAEPRWGIMPSSGVGATVVVTMPGPPTGVRASVPAPGATWTSVSASPADGPTPVGYQVRCVPVGVAFNTSPNVNPAVVFTGGTTLPVVVNGLARGTTYHCMVRARYGLFYATESGDGYEGPLSGWSNSFTVPVVAPPTPSGVVAATQAAPYQRTVIVHWANVVNTTGAAVTFDVRCVSSNGGVTRTATTAGSSVQVWTLTRGKRYVCQVRATNSKGSSAWTSSNQFTTP